MKKMKIKERVFIVGCPRSGTTLLQALLASHKDILSFPESHFFHQVAVQQGRRSGMFVSGKIKERLRRFLVESGNEELARLLPRGAIFLNRYAGAFVNILDTAALNRGRTVWLEKTPRHLHYVDTIRRYVPLAKFIHILRRGQDVVASLYQVTHRYPETWRGERGIDECIDRWLDDVKISLGYLEDPDHTLVRYERLVQEPEAVLHRLCRFMGVTYDQAMLTVYRRESEKLISANEPWKDTVKKDISTAASGKFFEVFNAQQRRYILERLSVIDLEGIET
jgi:hypothetical protein